MDKTQFNNVKTQEILDEVHQQNRYCFKLGQVFED
jgi:hypothetical protein